MLRIKNIVVYVVYAKSTGKRENIKWGGGELDAEGVRTGLARCSQEEPLCPIRAPEVIHLFRSTSQCDRGN